MLIYIKEAELKFDSASLLFYNMTFCDCLPMVTI